jgi:transcriptional regulator with XRE-family HTH domain
MYRDNFTKLSPEMQSPQILYRGLYIRIARKLGVDPSYVSRVARGDRRSSQIESALRQELEDINRQLGRGSAALERSLSRPASESKRLEILVKQNRTRIHEEWLSHSQADPNLKRVKVSSRKRMAPILPVLDEAMKVMKLDVKDMTTVRTKAAEQHGRLRQAQGFSATALVEEYNLVRRCIFGLAQEHVRQMDAQILIRDLTQFGEALDLQTQRALADYLASA